MAEKHRKINSPNVQIAISSHHVHLQMPNTDQLKLLMSETHRDQKLDVKKNEGGKKKQSQRDGLEKGPRLTKPKGNGTF